MYTLKTKSRLKEYVVANLQNLEHKEILEALLFSLQLIKSEKGLEGTQWTKPTCDFIKKEFEKMIDLTSSAMFSTSCMSMLSMEYSSVSSISR